MWEQRLDATVYTLESTDDKMIAGLRKAIAEGLTDTEMLTRFNTDTTSLLTIDHRKFQKGDDELIDSLEWKPGLAPESIDDGKVRLVNIHALLSPEPRKLNEARGLITADYQNYLEQEWIRELRARYPFKVYDEVLSSIK